MWDPVKYRRAVARILEADAKMTPVRHGVFWDGISLPVWLGPDPDLALVTADPVAWDKAHPCDCEGVCTCDNEAA